MSGPTGRWSALVRVALPVLLGMLLLQAAWITTLPPYRGTDEVDHAYRASEVASGDLLSDRGSVAGGRGILEPVPSQVVEAARPVCTSYSYMERYNCHPYRALADGRVLVAGAAATYSPVYYAAVGPLARFLAGSDGDGFLLTVRWLTALACAVLVAAGAWALGLGARTRWPVVALLVSVTPVLLYSTSVAAPNGVELAAAVALWSALLALTRPSARDHVVPLLVLGGGAAGLLVVLRSIGPLWAALVLLTVAALAGASTVRGLATAHRRGVATVTGLVGLLTLASAWWTRHAGVPDFEARPRLQGSPAATTLEQYPLWLLQAIAAFPRRRDPAPAVVYLLVGVLLLGLLVAGVRAADRRLRLTMAVAALVTVAVPSVLTLTTVATTGPIWQGRYGAPYHVGLVLLAGLALDRRAAAARTPAASRVPVTVVLVVLLAHALSVLAVLDRESTTGPVAASGWAHLPGWGVVLLVLVAALCWSRAVVAPLVTATDLDRPPAVREPARG